MNFASRFFNPLLHFLVVSLVTAIVLFSVYSGGKYQPAQEGLLFKVVPAGTIVAFAGNEIPQGWLECKGQVINKEQYPALADALKGTFWNGENIQFALPDLRGRVPIGAIGAGETLAGLTNRSIGATGGEENHTLTESEMPKHTHGVTDPGHVHDQLMTAINTGEGGPSIKHITYSGDAYVNGQPRGGTYAHGITTWHSGTGVSIQHSGGNQPHNNMPPFIVLRYIIKH
jgi:microcystin-dependent protein